jgi:hypothetical protein
MLESCPQGRFQSQSSNQRIFSLVFGPDGGKTSRPSLGLATFSFQPCVSTVPINGPDQREVFDTKGRGRKTLVQDHRLRSFSVVPQDKLEKDRESVAS